MKHLTCKAGAAVRLHLYMPARVVRVWRDALFDCLRADCIVTVRRAGVGPHGYRPGEHVTVRASEAVPRDCIRVMRGTSGRLAASHFDCEVQS